MNKINIESALARTLSTEKFAADHGLDLTSLWFLHHNIRGRKALTSILIVLLNVHDDEVKMNVPDNITKQVLTYLPLVLKPSRRSGYDHRIGRPGHPDLLSPGQQEYMINLGRPYLDYYSRNLNRMDEQRADDGYPYTSHLRRRYAGRCDCSDYSTCDVHAEYLIERYGAPE